MTHSNAPGIGRTAIPENRLLSPYTGYTREHWAATADDSLLSVRPFASPRHGLITLPGEPGGLGTAIDGLEGFARSFMAAGFRLAGEGGRDPNDLADWYARGLDAGTDPHSPERWTTMDEHRQARVESAAIALTLHITRPWIWDRLDGRVKQQIMEYFALVIESETARNNWVWFRIVIEQFLRSVGGPWDRGDLEEDLARHDSFVRADGWYCDGDGRSFDHYNGWALHFYPILWLEMAGNEPLALERRDRFHAHLDRFLRDAPLLVGSDGAPLIQGRSLTYRYATAAPFWVGALAGSPAITPGLARRASSGILRYFADNRAPDESGLLSLGWHRPWRPIAQTYSGTGSPYWASKGFLGLALPAHHPVWTAIEEPLPIETDDAHTLAVAPGWLISGTRTDGIVRVINHGTDHSDPGRFVTDSPLYARLGYSTATSPLIAAPDELEPFDQSVVLLDESGAPSHRAGFVAGEMRSLSTRHSSDAAAMFASSRSQAHWVEPDPGSPGFGWGHDGDVRKGHSITTCSLVRGPWEVRFVRVDEAEDAEVAVGVLRFGGWPIEVDAAAADALSVHSESAARTARLVSAMSDLGGAPEAGVRIAADATPLSRLTAVPWRRTGGTAEFGRWYAVGIALVGSAGNDGRHPLDGLTLTLDESGTALVSWPDGGATSVDLAEA